MPKITKRKAVAGSRQSDTITITSDETNQFQYFYLKSKGL